MNNSDLIALIKNGQRVKYLFFWGHTPKSPLVVDKSCFSQWYLSEFTINGMLYQTAEHWMMAEKARLFGDMTMADRIVAAQSPGEAKKLGRMVSNFNAEKWDANKYHIVVKGNFIKFSQNEPLKEFLLNTNNRILVEASPVDAIWGVGLSADSDNIEIPEKWRGENLLGYALMDVRDQLINEK